MSEQDQITKSRIAGVEFWSMASGQALTQERLAHFRDYLNEKLSHHEELYGQRGYIVADPQEPVENTCEPGSFRHLINVYAVFGGDIPPPTGRGDKIPEDVLAQVESLFNKNVFIVSFFFDDQGEKLEVIQATRHCEALRLDNDGKKITGGFIYSFGFICQHELASDSPLTYQVARSKTEELGKQLQRQVPQDLKSLPAWIIIHSKGLSGKVIAVHEYLFFTDLFGPVGVVTQEKAEQITNYVLDNFGSLLKVAHDEYCSVHVDSLIIPDRITLGNEMKSSLSE